MGWWSGIPSLPERIGAERTRRVRQAGSSSNEASRARARPAPREIRMEGPMRLRWSRVGSSLCLTKPTAKAKACKIHHKVQRMTVMTRETENEGTKYAAQVTWRDDARRLVCMRSKAD